MKINEEFIDDIEIQNDDVSVINDSSETYPYTLKLKTSVIPKGRGLSFYFDNIMKMNRVIDFALSRFPMIETYDHDFEIRRLSGGEMSIDD